MAQVPDVRVRLSPEGVQEVVGAFQRVRREAETSGRVSTRAVGAVTSAVGELVRLLPAISFAVLTREIVTRTIDAERTLNRLNTVLQTTGFSAGLTAKELNEIAEALKRTTPFDDDEIRKGISSLLRFRDVQGDVFREAIKLVADLAVALETDFATAAQRLGRALVDPASMRALRAAGVNLSESQIELATNLRNTNNVADSMRVVLDSLKKSVGGAAAGENVGLYGSTRALSKAWDDLLKALGKRLSAGEGESIIGRLTREVQTLARVISESNILQSLLAFATLGQVLPTPERREGDEEIEAINKQIELARRQLAAGSLNPPGATSRLFSFLIPDIKLGKDAIAELTQTINRLEAERARLLKIQAERLPPPAAEPSTGDSDEERARQGQAARDAERNAEFQATVAKARREHEIAVGRLNAERDLAREKQFADQRLRILDQFFSQGLISLEEYHQRRRTVIAIELAAEIEALKAKLLEEQKVLEKANAEGDLPKASSALLSMERLVNDIELRQERAAAALINSLLQESEQREQLGKEQLSMDVKLLESQGRRKDAALLALEQEIRETEKLLRLRGQSPDQIAGRAGQLRAAGTRNIEFEEQTRQSSLALRQIELEREEINRQVAQGILFQFQGEEKIIELEQRRLPLLREIAAEMQRTAFTDEQKLAADEFAASVERIAVNINKAGREMAEFKQRAFDAVSSDLSNFLTDGIRDAKNFGDAIKTLAFNLSQSFQKISADILAKKLTEKLFSFVGGITGEGPEKVATAAAAGAAQAGPLTAAATLLQTAGFAVSSGAAAISVAAGQLLTAASALASAGVASAAGSAVSGAGLFAGFAASAGAGFARGGMIRGPGGPTGDKIPALLSDGEFVIRSAAVRSLGTDLLESLNRGIRTPPIRAIDRTPYVPRFAEGGLVGRSGGTSQDSSLTVRLGPGLLADELNTPDGQRVLVQAISKNKRSVRGGLGV